MTPEDWYDHMDRGRFVKPNHQAYCAILYYFAVRGGEAVKATKEQFAIGDTDFYYDVGKRLKHSERTATLSISKDRPYVDAIVKAVHATREGQRVFPFTTRTGRNIVYRVFPTYPHFFRLNRITQMFNDGWTVTEVRSWTGLTLNALNYYVGLAAIREKGRTIR
jgi:hypothetical protein